MNRISLTLSIAAWLGAIAVGLIAEARYEVTPGSSPSADSGTNLRLQQTSLSRRQTTPNLVLFVHPRCPCSRASLDSLARILTRCKGLVATQVYMVRPPGADHRFVHSDLWDEAAAIPGVVVAEDDGREARRLEAQTSGQAYLFDSHGSLAFQGGITDSRGMEGDSTGAKAIIDAVTDRPTSLHHSQVYGCALFSKNSRHQ